MGSSGPRRLRAAIVAPALLLAACGSGDRTGSATGSASLGVTTPSPTPTPTATPTPAATPATTRPTMLVWAVGSGGSSQVRTVPIGGGTVHVVTTLPADALVLGSGTGKLAVAYADHSIHVIELASGAVNVYSTGAPQALFGGAFSPDGTRFAYVTATSSPPGGKLQVVNLVTKAATTLRSFPSNTYDVPQRWLSDAIAGTAIVGFADAGPQAVVRLDPASGARIGSSDVSGSGAVAISPDGVHAAVSKHSSLGDDGDSPGGPGPQQPFNTLRSMSIGSAPADVFQEPHHQVVALALSATGDTICYSDDPAGGGFAGATMSTSLGLFLRKGSTTTQLAHWDGSRWDAGVFVDSAVALANHTSAAEKLMLVSAGGAPSVLDTVSGADSPVFVGTA